MLIYNGLIFFLNIQKNILNLLNLIIIPNPNNLSLTVISESNDKNLGFDSQTKLKQSTKRKKIKKKYKQSITDNNPTMVSLHATHHVEEICVSI